LPYGPTKAFWEYNSVTEYLRCPAYWKTVEIIFCVNLIMYVPKTALTKQDKTLDISDNRWQTALYSVATLPSLVQLETSLVYNGYLLLTSSDPIKLVLPWLLLQQWLRSANPVLWCDQRQRNVQLRRVISVSRDGRLKTTQRWPAEFVATGSAVRITRKRVSKREEISEQKAAREKRGSDKVWLLEVEPPVCLHCFKRPIQNVGDLLHPRVFCVNVYKVRSWNFSPSGIITAHKEALFTPYYNCDAKPFIYSMKGCLSAYQFLTDGTPFGKPPPPPAYHRLSLTRSTNSQNV
jgi:hypothetical protein